MFRIMRGVVLVAIVLLAGCSAMGLEREGADEARKEQERRDNGQLPAESDTTQNMTDSDGESGNQGESENDGKTDGEAQASDDGAGEETTAPENERVDEVAFGTQRFALTEALGRAQERVDVQKEKIAELEEELGDVRSELEKVRGEKDNLEGRLGTYKEQIEEFEEAMSKWKKDVLGFRDEMRESEKAEMQALKQIIILLRKASRNNGDVSEESEAEEEIEGIEEEEEEEEEKEEEETDGENGEGDNQ